MDHLELKRPDITGVPHREFLHLHECHLALLCPPDQIWGTISAEGSQGAGKCCEVFGFRRWIGCNGCCFLHMRVHLPTSKEGPLALYLPPSNHTLLGFAKMWFDL